MESGNTDFEFVAVVIDSANDSFLSEVEKDDAPAIDDPVVESPLPVDDFQQDLSDLNVKIIEEEPPSSSDDKVGEDAKTKVDNESPDEEMSTGSEMEEVPTSEQSKLEAPRKINYVKQKKKRRRKGSTSLVCKECGYKGAAVKDMKRHERTHTGEKPYVCSICNFRTAHPSSYRRHLNIHNGIKPYACTECSYRSAYRHHLESHLSHHTGVKPFSCNLCSYKSAYRHHLENHQTVHTGNKYNCTECFYSTSVLKLFQRHMTQHPELKQEHDETTYGDQTPYIDDSQYNEYISNDNFARDDSGLSEEFDHQRHFMALGSDDLVTAEITEGPIASPNST